MADGGRRRSPSRWAGIRRGGLLLAALSTAFLTSGCSVSINGVTGIGVDEQGRLVGYLKVCSFHAASALLWSDAEGQPVGEWTPPEPITDFGTWLIDGATDGWTTEKAPPAPSEVEYRLEGRTDELIAGAARTVSIRYTAQDLASLRPGEVLWTISRFHEKPRRTTVTSVDEFRMTGCSVQDAYPDVGETP